MEHNKSVLANGTRIISERVPHAKSVSLGVWVNAGSRDEHEKDRGIFHLIEHMIFKGTRRRSAMQIAKDLDTIGGFSNAFTTKEQTCFHGRVLNKHLKFLTELFSDIFVDSLFAEEDLELEKSVVIQEISMMEDTHDEYIQILSDQSFWAGEPLGMPILGTRETVSTITRKQIFDYRSRFYSPERVVIAAAGKVDHDLLVNYFKPFFEPLQGKNDTPLARFAPSGTPTASFFPKELEQVHLCLGARAASLSAKERFAEAVFNTILGGNMSSRLFQEIREKRGLAYSLYSYLSAYTDTGIVRIYVATDKTSVNRVLELIGSLIKGIQGGDLTSDDIGSAKDYLIGGILLAAESMNSRMMRLAKNEFVFERYVPQEELLAELNKVTVGEVVEASRRMFAAHNVSLTVLGPVDGDSIAVDPLEFS
jgi:predicted Zn-dependent peptidase